MHCAVCGKEIAGEPVMQTYSTRYGLPYQSKDQGNWKWIRFALNAPSAALACPGSCSLLSASLSVYWA